MDVQAIARRIREYREYLESLYGSQSKALIPYGSWARGSATPDSHVDLLVVVDDALDPWSVRRSLDGILFDILLEASRLVSTIVLPQSDYEGLPVRVPCPCSAGGGQGMSEIRDFLREAHAFVAQVRAHL
ncbi:MAG: nucleotidyltransferase family protein [Thermodesulfobacteriota bacterium]